MWSSKRITSFTATCECWVSHNKRQEKKEGNENGLHFEGIVIYDSYHNVSIQNCTCGSEWFVGVPQLLFVPNFYYGEKLKFLNASCQMFHNCPLSRYVDPKGTLTMTGILESTHDDNIAFRDSFFTWIES
jgi:hypothetical protein